MNWLPLHRDFGRALKALRDSERDVDVFDGLSSLARHRLSYLETIQLDNALRRLRPRFEANAPRLRIALVASMTVDHLAPALRVAGLRCGQLVDVHVGAYGQYRHDVMDPKSTLHQFAPNAVIFVLDAREVLSQVALGASADEVAGVVGRMCDELAGLWRIVRERHSALIVQQTLLDSSEALFGSYDRLVPSAPASVVRTFNDAIAKRAANEGALLLDVAHASERDGLEAWFDRSRWLQGKIEIAPAKAPEYGERALRLIAAARGESKKCLVLDLDNTLWGGVIGDDGMEGIRLGEGSAVGEAHSALQRYAKALKDRGVILAVCSKNDPAIAEAAFRDHPEMVLRRADISAFIANWQDKAQNLPAIAEQLNIGIGSLVFVDDNPVERARIRESLPMIAVPELPEDPALFVSCLAAAGYFEAVSFTQEERERAKQYAENAERDAFRSGAQTIDSFLAGLEMTVVFGPVRAVDQVRVTQLVNKTNQFNTTTRRYTEDQIKKFADDRSGMTLQFRLLDRFGDNGLVSVMLLKPIADAPEQLDIDSWVMSCRVFGRGLEKEAMTIAVELARDRGIRELRADFVPTKRNGVVSELYRGLGFVELATSCEKREQRSRWSLKVDAYEPVRTFIERQAQQ